MGGPCGGRRGPRGLAWDRASGWSSFGAGLPPGCGPWERALLRPAAGEASRDSCTPEPLWLARGPGPLFIGRAAHLQPPPSPFLWTTGISGKSQVLFAVVFTARYLDLFTNYISLYNTCMKVKAFPNLPGPPEGGAGEGPREEGMWVPDFWV